MTMQNKQSTSSNSGFAGGFIFGVITMFIMIAIFEPSNEDMIAECEATLPRDQVCEVVAVPVDKTHESE